MIRLYPTLGAALVVIGVVAGAMGMVPSESTWRQSSIEERNQVVTKCAYRGDETRCIAGQYTEVSGGCVGFAEWIEFESRTCGETHSVLRCVKHGESCVIEPTSIRDARESP